MIIEAVNYVINVEEIVFVLYDRKNEIMSIGFCGIEKPIEFKSVNQATFDIVKSQIRGCFLPEYVKMVEKAH